MQKIGGRHGGLEIPCVAEASDAKKVVIFDHVQCSNKCLGVPIFPRLPRDKFSTNNINVMIGANNFWIFLSTTIQLLICVTRML